MEKFEENIIRNYYDRFVRLLKDHDMSAGEMLDELHLKHTPVNYSRMKRFIMTISMDHPIFEPIPARFKILTDKDLDEYEDLYRRQKQDARRYDMAQASKRSTN